MTLTKTHAPISVFTGLVVCVTVSVFCDDLPTNCHPFKPNPDDGATYMRYVNSAWGVYPCAPGTVWNQETCICSNKPLVFCQRGPVDVKKLTDNCKKKHNGLAWSATLCQCVWERKPKNMDPDYDPVKCEIVLHLQFDKIPPTDSRNLFVQSTNPELVEIVGDYGANDGVAVYLPEVPLVVPGLLGNDLSDAFRVNVRFRVDAIPYLVNKFQLVFGNGCPEHAAILSLSYRANDQRYRIRYVDEHGQSAHLECRYVAGSAYSWKSVVVILQDDWVHLFVNDKPCGKQKADVEEMGRFRCALAIGGGQLGAGEGPFVGYFDNLMMVRRCKVPLPDN